MIPMSMPTPGQMREIAAGEERKRRLLLETESAPGTAVPIRAISSANSPWNTYEEEVAHAAARAQRPQPAYCCDRMRTAAEAEIISFEESPAIVEEGDSWFGTQPAIWPINYCPFCGTAVGRESDTDRGVRELIQVFATAFGISSEEVERRVADVRSANANQ
jgi:hypothetical protein